MPTPLTLNDPGIVTSFKRTFGLADSHLYYITVFGRANLPGDLVKKASAEIEGYIKDVIKKIDDENVRCTTVLESSGSFVGEPIGSQEFTASATSRLSKIYLDFFRRADHLASLYNSLWIEGIVDDDTLAGSERKVRGWCHSIASLIHKTFEKAMEANGKVVRQKRGERPEKKVDDTASPSPSADAPLVTSPEIIEAAA